ncbi:MAG: DUF6356 family protein [Candidatus Poseidoniales archaeon]
MIWKHPKAIGKNWFTHLLGAWKMAAIFQMGAIRCIVHGLIPDFDINAATNTAAAATEIIPEED